MEHRYRGSEEFEGRRDLVARLLKERPWCEVCEDLSFPGSVLLPSVDVHEILPRSAGGSILDETNALCVCRPHHMRIHRSPTWAKERGYLKGRYE